MKALQQLSITGLLQLFLGVSAMAQTPVWLSHYGNGGNPFNEGVYLVTNEQGYVYGSAILGGPGLDMDGHELAVQGQRDVLLVKWDSTGHVLWANTAGGTVSKAAPEGTDKDGGGWLTHDPQTDRVIQCGNYGTPNSYFGPYVLHGPSNGDAGNFVASYNSVGDCLWVRAYEGYAVTARTLIDDVSNVYLFGSPRYGGTTFLSQPSMSLLPGGFIAKYAMDGTLVEAERVVVQGTIGASAWSGPGQWAFGGQLNAEATIYGQPVQNIGSDGTAYVAQSDTSGVVQWITTFPSDSTSVILNIAVLGTGQIVVSGYFFNELTISNDTLVGVPGIRTYFLACLSANGIPIWAHTLSSPGQQTYISALSAAVDGDIYACGIFTDSIFVQDVSLAASTSRDGFVLRMRPDGSVAALQNFGRVRTMRSIIPTDNGILISGTYDSTLVIGSTSVPNSLAPSSQTGLADFFIAKFDSLSGVTQVTKMAPMDASLRIYANPNNGLCTVELPDGVHLTPDMVMTIYDNTGKVVQRIPVNYSTRGIELDVRAEAKGLYHVELSDGEKRYTGTIVFE